MDIPPELVAAKNAAEFALLQLPGVIGVGIGFREENGELFDEVAVRIHLADGFDPPPDLPRELGGAVVCTVPGSIFPCLTPDTTRYSDLGGGMMVTNPLRGSGTMGVIVKDADTDVPLGLSCFHVVGDDTNSFPDTIWQASNPPLVPPIPRADNIGSVTRFDFPHNPPLPSSPVLVGLVDAAVFTLDEAQSQGRTLSPRIVSDSGKLPNLIDKLDGVGTLALGQQVRKRGFRTRLTTGFVVGIFSTFQWTAGPANAFLMEQAEVTGASTNPGGIFCLEGDSGAVVVEDLTPSVVGVIWGNKLGGLHGIISSAVNVESQLGVRFVW
jgi:hypothetical protein